MLPAAMPFAGPPGYYVRHRPETTLRHLAITWAQRLARVFRIDITRCERCGRPTRIIASLSDPAVIGRILAARGGAELHGPARGPPQGKLLLG